MIAEMLNVVHSNALIYCFATQAHIWVHSGHGSYRTSSNHGSYCYCNASRPTTHCRVFGETSVCHRINEPTQHHVLSLQPHLFQRSKRYSVCTDISRLFELCMMLAWVELCVLQSLTEGNGYYSSIAVKSYILHHYLTTDLNYVMLMSPWMMEKFNHADYIEIDVTFNVTAEFQYLLNAVTFDYSTCKCTDDYLSIHTFTNVCKH